MKITRIFVALAALIWSSFAFSMAEWNEANRPELMGNDFERSFSKLPTKGELKTTPWSGDYWPTYKGGITYRWNKKFDTKEEERWSYELEDFANIEGLVKDLSPAEKFDLFLGQEEYPLVKYERERTKILKTVKENALYEEEFEIPTWEGLCHAWAPATLHYGEPEPITVTGAKGHEITFGSSDIKALLTYHIQINKGIKSRFLGSRCYLDFSELREQLKKGEITQEELDEKMNSEACADTNAGAFHVVMANQIAMRDEGFVIDITRDTEVWNQPVTSFESRVLKVSEEASEGAAPGTVKEISIYTKLGYIAEIPQTFDLRLSPWRVKVAYYYYRLELNEEGQIIGGEWTSEARPDFIWKKKPSKFRGYFAKLEELYKRSTAYLHPSKFTQELKDKFRKLGKKELIKQSFIKKMKIDAAKTRVKKSLRKDFLNSKVVAGFKEAGKDARTKRVKARFAFIKKEQKPKYLAQKFVKEISSDAKETRNIKEVHKAQAIKALKAKMSRDFISSKFIKEVSADAKETRKVKEEHKAAAKKEVLRAAKVSFIKKKFIKEVSADAKETRRIKEEHKAAAKKEVLGIAKVSFLKKKFIKEVSADAKESRRIKEEHKSVAKLALKKKIKTDFISKKFIKELAADAKETKRIKAEAEKFKEVRAKVIAAIMDEKVSTLKRLIKKGVQLGFIDPESGLTPLMVAAKINNLNIVKLLVSKMDKKDLDMLDKDGKNALIWAITGPGKKPDAKTRKIVKFLVGSGIDFKVEDKNGLSALDYVSIRKYKSKRLEWFLESKGA